MPAEKTGPEHESQSPAYPSHRYASYVLALLTLAYIVSYIDRQILGLLVEPIKADLGLTDTEMGLLLGVAFAIFYGTVGIPLGWLADNMKRRSLLAICISLWSLATLASGFAKNFTHLFVARVAVGAGEAALAPCAVSMISDLFPPYKRARAISIYTAAIALSMAIAYLGGGALLEWAETLDLGNLPIPGISRSWQLVFVIVALPGFLLSLLFIFVREPERKPEQNVAEQVTGQTGFTSAFRFLRKSGGAVFGVCAIGSSMTVIVYSQFFCAAMFERTWGWNASEFGVRYGAGLLVLAPIAGFVSGWVIDRYYKSGALDGGMRVMALGLPILIVCSAAFPLVPDAWLALTILVLSLLGASMITAAALPAILTVIPHNNRGQITAIYYMIISLFGLLLGPTSVGFATDFYFGDPMMLRYSMALVAGIAGVPVLIALPFIRRVYANHIRNDSITRQQG